MKYLALFLFVLMVDGCHQEGEGVMGGAKENDAKFTTPLDTAEGLIYPPSYTDPREYRITLEKDKYVARLPHGVVIGVFDTRREAQEEINDYVKQSKERWEDRRGY